MSVTFQTSLNALRSLPGSFDLSGLSDVSLQYDAELGLLGDLTGDWQPVSLSDTLAVLQNGAFTATLSGPGGTPVTSQSAFEAALAAGAYPNLAFDYNGTRIAELAFANGSVTLTSGQSELVLSGVPSGTLEWVFTLIEAWSALENFSDLPTSEQDLLITAMQGISLDGLSFSQGGTTLLDLTLDEDGAILVVGGLELSLEGTVPGSLGDLLSLVQEIGAAQGETLPAGATQIRFLDRDGTELPGFETITQGPLTFTTSYNTYPGGASYSGGPTPELIQIEISSPGGQSGFYALGVVQNGGSSDTITQESTLGDPLLLSDSGTVHGTLADGTDVDTYLLLLPGFETLSVYATGASQPIDTNLLTELALSGGSLGLAGAALPVFTISGDVTQFVTHLAADLPTRIAIKVGSMTFDGLSLDLDERAQSGSSFDRLESGADLALGYAGDDTIIGEGGDDFIDGGADHDRLLGNQGDDTLLGQSGADTLDGGIGDDSISGGNSDDLILGGGGFDLLRGGAGDDTINGGDGQDTVYMGGGDDLFVDNGQGGTNGIDRVYGNGGDDTFGGGNGNDVFFGQDGADRLLGRLGHDKLFGGNQNDTMVGGDGNDTVAGGNGRDRAYMGNGHDRWFDNAQGQFGDDLVVGGAGNDTIGMWGGEDTATGGGGADVFEFIGSGFGHDVITDFEIGTDRLGIDGGLISLTQSALDAASDMSSGMLVLTFAGGAASITFENLGSNAGLLADIFEL